MITSSTNTPDADALLDHSLKDALHRVWGFSGFRPLQREAMLAILASRDSVIVLPTGGGKSLCFQAPAIITSSPATAGHYVQDGDARIGVAVVISPLISRSE